MSQTSEYKDQLDEQRVAYANRLPGTVSGINELWQRLCNIGWDKKAFSTLCNQVHKIAGTGRSYGFEEVSRHALILEQIFKKIEKADCVPSETDKQLIEVRLAELKRHSSQQSQTNLVLKLPKITPANATNLVYIVDDDEDASRLFETILKSAGYNTEIFPGLSGFHQALEQRAPDLIIMDVAFPEGSLAGIDAINQLESQLGKSIPIIFISARNDVVARIRALRAGGCAYITKPVESDVLLRVVANNSRVEQRQKRVLLIDDDPSILAYCEILLEDAHYEVATTEDPLEMLHVIEVFQPDAIVVDYNMPQCTGQELVNLLRMDHRYINLPVIMLTAERDPELLQQISLLSNTRFHSKPIHDDALLETISNSIHTASRSQKRMLNVIKQHSQGLSNLNYFYSELETIVASANRDDKPYTLLYCAIDDPISIRERVGLRELDNLNKKISSHLLTLVGKNELIAQLTEFVYLVLIHVDDQSRLKKSIDTIKNMLVRKVFTIDEIEISVTASIGAISISPRINSLDEAVSIAERASVSASQDGGDRVCIEVSSKGNGDVLDKNIGRAFMETFKNDSLRLQYQPIVNIDTSESVYEAYARFVAGDKIITPEQFLPYVEEYNLEFEFNKKIVIAATTDIFKSVNKLPGAKKTVLIKLEPTRKTMLEFMDWFAEYIDTERINIDNNLVFSFREEWILKNRDSFKDFMEMTQRHNCGIGLDHAGISKYTADLVGAIKPLYTKLSPQFVDRLLSSNPGDSTSVLRQLQAHDTCVVAGSVEDAAIFARLMALGIYQFQGYFVQHPGANLDFSVSQHFL